MGWCDTFLLGAVSCGPLRFFGLDHGVSLDYWDSLVSDTRLPR